MYLETNDIKKIIIILLWSAFCCFIGVQIGKYQIVKKANCDGTLKPATCDVALKLPKTYCVGTDENGITFYYDSVVNRLYLR
jgi:hypothetical protein